MAETKETLWMSRQTFQKHLDDWLAGKQRRHECPKNLYRIIRTICTNNGIVRIDKMLYDRDYEAGFFYASHNLELWLSDTGWQPASVRLTDSRLLVYQSIYAGGRVNVFRPGEWLETLKTLM